MEAKEETERRKLRGKKVVKPPATTATKPEVLPE